MEDSGVEDANSHTIYSEIEPQQDVEAVLHDPEADNTHRVAGVFEITLEKIVLPEVNNWVVLAKSLKGDLLLSGLHFDTRVRLLSNKLESRSLLNLVEMVG